MSQGSRESGDVVPMPMPEEESCRAGEEMLGKGKESVLGQGLLIRIHSPLQPF